MTDNDPGDVTDSLGIARFALVLKPATFSLLLPVLAGFGGWGGATNPLCLEFCGYHYRVHLSLGAESGPSESGQPEGALPNRP